MWVLLKFLCSFFVITCETSGLCKDFKRFKVFKCVVELKLMQNEVIESMFL